MNTRYYTGSVPSFSAVRQQPVARRSAEVKGRYIKQVVGLMFVVLAFLLFFAWTRVMVIQMGREVSGMRKATSDLMEQKNRLEAEVAALHAPGRLEKFAMEIFGMRLPMSDEIEFVESKEVPGNAEVQDR